MEVNIAADVDHRSRGALLHSAGHAIADLVQTLRPGLHAVAGHHWHGEARVEFEGAVALDEGLEDQLQSALSALAESDVPVFVEGDVFTDRKIRVGDFPAIGCGGTHLVSTASLAKIKITGIRSKRGRIRVSYE
jgi:Ser-tRNA(Ala) deacylase AlaX